MSRDQLNTLLQATPFRPFRVYVSDGGTYDVAHPEAAWIMAATLVTNVRSSGFAGPRGERVAYISLLHITRIEVYFPGPAPAP